MIELSKETTEIKQAFYMLKEDIKQHYQAGNITEYQLHQLSSLIDIAITEALMPGNTLNLLELRNAIKYGGRLRLLLAEKLYNEPIADDWKARLEECLNSELIC